MRGMTLPTKTCPRCGFIAPAASPKCPQCGLGPGPRPGFNWATKGPLVAGVVLIMLLLLGGASYYRKASIEPELSVVWRQEPIEGGWHVWGFVKNLTAKTLKIQGLLPEDITLRKSGFNQGDVPGYSIGRWIPFNTSLGQNYGQIEPLESVQVNWYVRTDQTFPPPVRFEDESGRDVPYSSQS